MRKSPRLKWLQIHPAGAERPIYRELRGRGVKVTTASGATAVTVSHSVLGALIAINRRFPLLADAQRRHAWEPRLGERSPRDLIGIEQGRFNQSTVSNGFRDLFSFSVIPQTSHLDFHEMSSPLGEVAGNGAGQLVANLSHGGFVL